MKFKSQVYTAVSGSIGGITYSHNKGGLYTRGRATPTNPASPQQVVVRNAVAQLTSRWTAVLTAAQRAAWASYADAVLIPDAFGDPRKIPALSHYVRSNVPRIQSALSIIDAGPTEPTLPTMSDQSFIPDVSSTNVSITFVNTDEWAGEVGGALLVLASRSQVVGITSWKGPYRYAGKISGAVTPPTSPQVIALPFPVVLDQRTFFQTRCVRADGRVSSPFRAFGVGVA